MSDVGAVLTVITVFGSTPVVLEVTIELEIEFQTKQKPTLGATIGVIEDEPEARPLDVS